MNTNAREINVIVKKNYRIYFETTKNSSLLQYHNINNIQENNFLMFPLFY